MRVDEDVACNIWQALGVGSTQLNVIGGTATYEISYRLVGTSFDAVVRPAAAVVTVGPCYSGEYFDGLVCQPCETGRGVVANKHSTDVESTNRVRVYV